MGSIRVLPPAVVNQIAAGEVIERPASLVKELIENSLDAGAKHVRIDIEEGGRKQVRITDDGAGMDVEDLPSAFEPHATSKLEDPEDLFRIATFGFRGEALASIGAVARVTVKSRPSGSEEGHEIRVEFGQRSEVRPAACPPGTDIDVRHLFQNTPARRKFLRKPEVEFDHIHEAVARFAVAHPEVRFDLSHNGVSVFALPEATNIRDRISHFFGKDLAASLLEVESEQPPTPFHALVAPPTYSKLSMKAVYVYLNGRFIRDRVVTRAINQAFRDVLPHGRFPVVFLFLTCQPGEVDVNVHPTKMEVRFRHVWKVHDLIVDQLHTKLLESDLAPQVHPSPVTSMAPPANFFRDVTDFFSAEAGAPAVATAPPLLMSGRRFFQLHDRYIIEEADIGIRIYDQHALHERVMLARFQKGYASGDLPSQKLLMPAIVELSPGGLDLLEEHDEILKSMGFEAERAGPKSLAVRATPAPLADEDPAGLVEDLVERIEQHGDSERKGGHRMALLEPMLEFFACRSAVRFGNRLAPEEVAHLLEEAASLDFSGTCAHGRPTAIQLTLEELERLFQRK